ncbi:hypothetical protein ACM66B_000392 [Microbotryomycetes sp. NB124-2]
MATSEAMDVDTARSLAEQRPDSARSVADASTNQVNAATPSQTDTHARLSTSGTRQDSVDLTSTRCGSKERATAAAMLPTPPLTTTNDDASSTTAAPTDEDNQAHSPAPPSEATSAIASSSGASARQTTRIRRPPRSSLSLILTKQLETDLVTPNDDNFLADGLEAGLYYIDPKHFPWARALATSTSTCSSPAPRRTLPARARPSAPANQARPPHLWPELKYYGKRLLDENRSFCLPLGLIREVYAIGIANAIKPGDNVVTVPSNSVIVYESKADKRRTPPSYGHLQQNFYVGRKPETAEEKLVCSCKPPKDPAEPGCGEDCMNRVMLYMCDPKSCPCKDRCSNVALHKRPMLSERADELRVFWTGNRGFGLKTQVPIRAGQFVCDYRGEVIHRDEAYRRVKRDYKHMSSYYFLDYDGYDVLDAGKRGNEARFINHSCEPNVRVVSWKMASFEEYQMGIYALRDIAAGEELTYDYGWQDFSSLRRKSAESASSSSSDLSSSDSESETTNSGSDSSDSESDSDSSLSSLSDTSELDKTRPLVVSPVKKSTVKSQPRSKISFSTSTPLATRQPLRQRCFCGTTSCSGYLDTRNAAKMAANIKKAPLDRRAKYLANVGPNSKLALALKQPVGADGNEKGVKSKGKKRAQQQTKRKTVTDPTKAVASGKKETSAQKKANAAVATVQGQKEQHMNQATLKEPPPKKTKIEHGEPSTSPSLSASTSSTTTTNPARAPVSMQAWPTTVQSVSAPLSTSTAAAAAAEDEVSSSSVSTHNPFSMTAGRTNSHSYTKPSAAEHNKSNANAEASTLSTTRKHSVAIETFERGVPVSYKYVANANKPVSVSAPSASTATKPTGRTSRASQLAMTFEQRAPPQIISKKLTQPSRQSSTKVSISSSRVPETKPGQVGKPLLEGVQMSVTKSLENAAISNVLKSAAEAVTSTSSLSINVQGGEHQERARETISPFAKFAIQRTTSKP